MIGLKKTSDKGKRKVPIGIKQFGNAKVLWHDLIVPVVGDGDQIGIGANGKIYQDGEICELATMIDGRHVGLLKGIVKTIVDASGYGHVYLVEMPKEGAE